jgi:hypothetical protein
MVMAAAVAAATLSQMALTRCCRREAAIPPPSRCRNRVEPIDGESYRRSLWSAKADNLHFDGTHARPFRFQQPRLSKGLDSIHSVSPSSTAGPLTGTVNIGPGSAAAHRRAIDRPNDQKSKQTSIPFSTCSPLFPIFLVLTSNSRWIQRQYGRNERGVTKA